MTDGLLIPQIQNNLVAKACILLHSIPLQVTRDNTDRVMKYSHMQSLLIYLLQLELQTLENPHMYYVLKSVLLWIKTCIYSSDTCRTISLLANSNTFTNLVPPLDHHYFNKKGSCPLT